MDLSFVRKKKILKYPVFELKWIDCINVYNQYIKCNSG